MHVTEEQYVMLIVLYAVIIAVTGIAFTRAKHVQNGSAQAVKEQTFKQRRRDLMKQLYKKKHSTI